MTKSKDETTYTVFEDASRLVRGDLEEVVLAVKKHIGAADHGNVLIFSDTTGNQLDFNFHGTKQDVEKRLETYASVGGEAKEPTGPGRPKLGVISREISLLPRHWEWLATQQGGASATIRNLVEEARKKASTVITVKQMQERAYQVMSVLAGDREGYEEALRALYKKDRETFQSHIQNWPTDIKKYVNELTKQIFE